MRDFSTRFTRRGLLRTAALSVGAAGGSMSGWLRALAASAPKKPAKSVISLWLNGGPATIDLWDLKPGHVNGGPFKEIETTAAGLRIGEHLPKLAKFGKDLALVRSMVTKEGDHARATYVGHTGYAPLGALKYPSMGAAIAKEIGDEASDFPNFVSVAPARYSTALGGGFLGPNFDPLVVGDQNAPDDGLVAPNLTRLPGVSDEAMNARLELIERIERKFVGGTSAVAESVQAATCRAVKLMRPEVAAAFDLDREQPELRDAYGRGLFGQGCLLARRLVERGVSFVEVTLDGWDSHENTFERVKTLCGTLDSAFAALLGDLKDRGLLDLTLVVCQGEFGRTPKINANVGRDHWPAGWALALAGGGLKTGQVIGKTTADGMAVEDRPRTIPDVIATIA
jgi:hypothetical protein